MPSPKANQVRRKPAGQQLEWRIINILARTFAVLALLAGLSGIAGGVLIEKDRALNLVVGLCALVVGILFLRVKKGSEADVKSLFRRKK